MSSKSRNKKTIQFNSQKLSKVFCVFNKLNGDNKTYLANLLCVASESTHVKVLHEPHRARETKTL